MAPYLILVAGWIVYFILHSVLAMDAIKSKFPPQFYRIFYVLFASVGLLALLFLNGSIHSLKFFVSEGPIRYISYFLSTFGVMVIQSSFRQYSFRGFVGLSNEPMKLRTDGVLQHIRHPILAGTMLIVLGFFFFIPNLPTAISCICVLLYIPIGIYFEEKKLIKAFGQEYIDYRNQVPAIIPRLKK